MSGLGSDWWQAVDAALSVGRSPYRTSQDLDLASEHVARLLRDATMLLEAGSHSSAAFMAITAIEEAAKVCIQVFRKSESAVPRRKDPLFSHGRKHHLALGPTAAMGSRLQKAVGVEQLNALMSDGRSGRFSALREGALYASMDEAGNLVVPDAVVTRRLARDLLLLAIETFDDGLAGYTSHSMELSKQADEYFARVARLA